MSSHATDIRQNLLTAQMGVLGSMLIDADAVGPVMAATSARDFKQPQFRLVYEAIRQLFEENCPVDAVTVNTRLGGQSSNLLLELMEATPTAANCDAYLSLLRDASDLDDLRELGHQLSDAVDREDALQVVERAGALLSQRSDLKIVSLADGLQDFILRHSSEAVPRYLPWEFGLSDYLFVEPGDFVVVGARPSVGKTSFALQQAYLQARNLRVGFFSLETSDRKLTDRLVANRAQVSLDAIKRHKLDEGACGSVAGLADTWRDIRLDFIPASGMSVSDIRAVSLGRRYDVIYVDYLQLIAGSRDAKLQSSFDRVSQISRDLHSFSQGAGVSVVALSQLSRGEKTKDGKVPWPRLSDLRESGQIEQDADVVIFLYKEDQDAPNSRRVLHVAKNKDGLSGAYQMLAFDGDHQRFRTSAAIYQKTQKRESAKQTSLFGFREVQPSGDEPV